VHERLETPLRVVDCSELGDAELVNLVQRDYEAPLDLEHGPALRVSLYTQPDQAPVLLVSIYHAFIDLWRRPAASLPAWLLRTRPMRTSCAGSAR
jgi:hypothetical protein